AWQEYQDAAAALYAKTRYCVKWKSSEGKLLKSDNTTCIKFKTYSTSFLNQFEALNLSLMEKMQNRRKVELPPAAPESAAAPSSAPTAAAEAGAAAGSSAAPSAAGAPAAGGVKKKSPRRSDPARQ
ncbi:hypothetical protein B0H14DRAFT_2393762, partial [Mycena olivaceomarginata]